MYYSKKKKENDAAPCSLSRAAHTTRAGALAAPLGSRSPSSLPVTGSRQPAPPPCAPLTARVRLRGSQLAAARRWRSLLVLGAPFPARRRVRPPPARLVRV